MAPRARYDVDRIGRGVTLHSAMATLTPIDLRRVVLDALVRADPRLSVIPETSFNVEWEWDNVDGPTAHVTAEHEVVTHPGGGDA